MRPQWPSHAKKVHCRVGGHGFFAEFFSSIVIAKLLHPRSAFSHKHFHSFFFFLRPAKHKKAEPQHCNYDCGRTKRSHGGGRRNGRLRSRAAGENFQVADACIVCLRGICGQFCLFSEFFAVTPTSKYPKQICFPSRCGFDWALPLVSCLFFGLFAFQRAKAKLCVFIVEM